MAIAGKVGAVYTLDPEAESTLFAGGAQACTGCPERKRYCVSEGERYLDPTKAVTVYRNDEPVTEGFHIEHISGCVVFREAQDVTDEIKLLASYFNPNDIKQSGGCFNWSISPSIDEKDVTTFKSAVDNQGWKSFIPLLKDWTASAEAYWGDYRFFESLGKTVVVKFFTDAGPAQSCLEGYAIVTSDSVEAPVDDVVEESIDFQGVGPLSAQVDGAAVQGGGGMGIMGGPGLMGGMFSDGDETEEEEEEEESEVFEEDED